MSVDSNSWYPCDSLQLGFGSHCLHIGLGLAARTYSQTASTGAVIGVTLDPSGAILPAVVVHYLQPGGGEKKSVTSDENGRFGFLLLPPGKYELQASAANFRAAEPHGNKRPSYGDSPARSASSARGAHRERTCVLRPLMVQLDSSALGRVVNENAVSGLPLVTRNLPKSQAFHLGFQRE